MHLGGAEISLIGLLQALDPEKVDVDLFVYSHEGELMKFIPEYVNLLPEIRQYSMFERPMGEVLKNGQLGVFVARIYAKFRIVHGVRMQFGFKKSDLDSDAYRGKWVSKVVPNINPSLEYDLAISFLTPHDFVRDHVRAKKKICWIHTDYTQININAEMELPVWDSFDHIMSISQDVTNSFLKVFPSLSSKIIVMENILSPEFVRRRAEEIGCKGMTGEIKLLSIGRFTYQKNFDNVPNICRRVLEKLDVNLNACCRQNDLDTRILYPKSIDIRWYIIGYGGDESLIRQKIIESDMQDHVIILGKKENPYPYIKACDIYVQPSRYEGKSVSVREAQMLCKPVVVANYPTASSQINDGVDGVIVPMDNEGCARGLADFILDEEKQKHIIDYLQTHDFGNVNEVNKIYGILGI